MTVTRDRLDQGMTYEQYVASMTKNRERLEQNEAEARLDADDLAFFRGLPQSLDVLVLAEDWCGDVIANLPVLARIAKESGKLRLHVFPRDQNEDLMNQYLKDGQFKSIPVFAFFDPDMREIGRFIERPADFTALRMRRRAELYEQHPEVGSSSTPVDQLTDEQRQKRQQLIGAMEAELVPVRVQMVVHDIRAACGGAVATGARA